MGRIAGPHGLRGMLRVRHFGDGPENLLRLTRLRLSRDAAEAPEGDDYEVTAATPGRPGEVRMGLAGITGREAAEALKGRFVWGEAHELEALPEGEHYWYQLVGCRVEARGGRSLGSVREVWETGAHDVLVVEDAAGRRLLLPTAKELMEIDVEAGRIVVEELPGLLDPID